MTKEDCGQHSCKMEKLHRRIMWGVIIFVALILLVILIVYLALLPSKPCFTLHDASIVHLNVTGPGILTSSIRVTIVSRNPNNRIGIYYDSLASHAAYLNQQISPPEELSPAFESPGESDVWTPLLCGTDVPVAPYLVASFQQAPAYASGMFSIRVAGKIRWQVGSWTSGHYGIYVQCDAYLPLSGEGPHNVLSMYPCHTDVWSQP